MLSGSDQDESMRRNFGFPLFMPLIFCVALSGCEVTAAGIPYLDEQKVSAGKIVYDSNCASCHGAALEGQPNWQKRSATGYLPAPPHDETGHTWHLPDHMLFEFTKYGPQSYAGADYKSARPAYEGKLSDEEIWNVLAFIKSQWPAEIQKKHTEVFSQK
jgi:mono/diheme cytochrome c family protein